MKRSPMRRFRYFALVCGWSMFGLTACTAWLKPAPPPPAISAQQRLYAIPHWTLEGRIAAKIGAEGWSANLRWEHGEDQERLRIYGPFNQGAVAIVVRPDAVDITESNGSVTHLSDPDSWLKARLGFVVPLRSLRYWVLGLPDPNSPYMAQPAGSGFTQQQWMLAVEQFETVNDWVLPKKMSLRADAVTLRLIVDEWFLKQ